MGLGPTEPRKGDRPGSRQCARPHVSNLSPCCCYCCGCHLSRWHSDSRARHAVLAQIIITSELDPNKLLCAKGEERLKERVQKVLTGILTKLESDPRMASSFKSGEHPEWM